MVWGRPQSTRKRKEGDLKSFFCFALAKFPNEMSVYSSICGTRVRREV